MSSLHDTMSSSNDRILLSDKALECIVQWKENTSPGFAALPIVWDSASGHTVIDIDGNKYIDMISLFAVVNFGHSHPRIVEAVVEQIRHCALINTSFINPLYGELGRRINQKYGYDSIAAMVSGAEAVDSMIKIARKWAYVHKGIENDSAIILTTDQCYHGLTLTTMGLSNRIAPNFGKHLPNVGPVDPTTGNVIRFGEHGDLKEALNNNADRVAAFLIEPVQGFAGTRSPPDGYLMRVQELCHKYDVLFLCDEIQTGLGRTGTDFAYQHEANVKPDIVALGKAITGGVTPMSLLMGKAHVMGVIENYDVVSTFAASPVACAAALVALDLLEKEALADRAQKLGHILTRAIDDAQLPHLLSHRGRERGLFQTLEVEEKPEHGVTAHRIAALCAARGVLCGNAANRVRISPPLVITEEALLEAVRVLASAFRDVSTWGGYAAIQRLVTR